MESYSTASDHRFRGYTLGLISPARWERWQLALMPLLIAVLALVAAGTLQAYSRQYVDSTHGGSEDFVFHAPEGIIKGERWGRLSWRRITLVPPRDAVASLAAVPPAAQWHFPEVSRDRLANFLAELPLDDDAFAALLGSVHASQAIDGFTISPDPQLLAQMPAETRTMLYTELGQSPLNRAQVNAFRFWGDSAERWFEATRLDPELREDVAPYIYRQGRLLFLADLEPVLNRVADDSQRLEVVRNLASESTLTLRLHVDPGQDVSPLVAYWGGRGRAKSIEPMLRSLAATPGGGSIDVAHLLPPFARKRLFTYPQARESGEYGDAGIGRDCHWTSLNFFNAKPDDRYADAAHVQAAWANDYTPASTPRFGDLVLLHDGARVYHSAVYIAGGVAFTKHGSRRARPWMLLPIEVMRDYYPRRDPITITYLRAVTRADRPPCGSGGREPPSSIAG